MGSEYSISVYLPDGRGFDDEVRGILKRVTFVPCPGTAVESALKLYGPGSLVPVASRFPVVKKMVERRGECSELIELLSTLTDDAATKAWCAERLKLINPGKYAPDTRASIPYYDYNDDAQQKAVMEMLGASKDAAKAVVTVPGGFAEPKPDSQAAPKAARSKSAPESSRAAYAAGKTKTITLPGGATMEMIYCPPGTFVMGSPEDEPGRAMQRKRPAGRVSFMGRRRRLPEEGRQRREVADGGGVGVRLPCRHDDAVPVGQDVQRDGMQLQRDGTLRDKSEGTESGAPFKGRLVSSECMGILRHERKRVRMVLRLVECRFQQDGFRRSRSARSWRRQKARAPQGKARRNVLPFGEELPQRDAFHDVSFRRASGWRLPHGDGRHVAVSKSKQRRQEHEQ